MACSISRNGICRDNALTEYAWLFHNRRRRRSAQIPDAGSLLTSLVACGTSVEDEKSR
ncbi:hypothetical protein NNRS527_02313 [Nitrosospira sp. NRS527]|nr:hypothetical protein NNRS527_02313 [Nitrosospira sp. NRS527]